MFDSMFEQTTVVVDKPNNPKEVSARRICSESLKSLGYEVNEGNGTSGIDLIIAKGTIKYSLNLSFAGEKGATHFRIPVGAIDSDQPTIFKMEADCIAFYQEAVGTLYQFKLQALRELLEPVVARLKNDMKIKFYAENAIAEKRLHVSYNADDHSYVIYLYLPIEALCKQLKYSKQPISK